MHIESIHTYLVLATERKSESALAQFGKTYTVFPFTWIVEPGEGTPHVYEIASNLVELAQSERLTTSRVPITGFDGPPGFKHNSRICPAERGVYIDLHRVRRASPLGTVLLSGRSTVSLSQNPHSSWRYGPVSPLGRVQERFENDVWYSTSSLEVSTPTEDCAECNDCSVSEDGSDGDKRFKVDGPCEEEGCSVKGLNYVARLSRGAIACSRELRGLTFGLQILFDRSTQRVTEVKYVWLCDYVARCLLENLWGFWSTSRSAL